ncbi:MAG TPA: thioredoxin family protein [Bacteroidia bacterium]|nr:thioredoxin family protein [Bacteroidia bacterium]HNT80364.1 thioredoxin family protein [Bacteroidia bacterium]
MVKTLSQMNGLKNSLPNFQVLDVVSGKIISEQDYKNGITLYMFICNHCPYVKWVLPELIKLGNDYKNKPIKILAISSNDIVSHPDDHPDKMKDLAVQMQFPFNYAFDESQKMASDFGAVCTPDFFIYDEQNVLQYTGQLDDSRPNSNVLPSGNDIRNAFDALIEKRPIDFDMKPSIGCNIKWKEA